MSQSTQVPQYILDNWKQRKQECNIIVSQPRKIAAITIAQRVANERKSDIGHEVGYQVGLSKKADVMNDARNTKILYCTTGVILERLLHEKNMSRYTHIILDEVHERDVNIDFLLIVIRKLLSRDSPKTKIILMSATMDTEQFADFFTVTLDDGTEYRPPVIDLTNSPRSFEIKEFYLEEFEKVWLDGNIRDLINYEEPDISDGMYDFSVMILVILLRQLLAKQHMAPVVLVFLPGLREIECFRSKLCVEGISKQFQAMSVDPRICILHSSLSTEDQRYAFLPSDQPKIILATNIAESGVTIPGVSHVLDFCLTKYLGVAKGAQITTLMLDWTSKNNCKQRAGRAGRVCTGTVVRLVEKAFYENKMKDYPAPEIQRIGIESVVIKIKMLNMGTPLAILALALDPPTKSAVVDAVLYLKELGGLSRINFGGRFDDTDGDLTFIGRIMGNLPVDVRLVKLIVIGYLFDVLEEAIVIAAGLSLKSIFTQNLNQRMNTYLQKLKLAGGSGSDCIAILNAYNMWKQLRGIEFALNSSLERQWCQTRNLDVKNLHEMELLVTEITKRLERAFNIRPSDNCRLMYNSREKLFMIKICIAGALGPANFFVPIENTENDEREAFKTVNNMDLFRTVYFKNMDRETFGDIYEEQIHQAFEQKNIVDNKEDMRVFFDYRISEKVYVTFKNDRPITEMKDAKIAPGKVLPEVYKAVKLRQIAGNLTLNVMSREETIKYALDQELATMKEGNLVRIETVIDNPSYCVEPTSVVIKMHGYVTHVENCNKFFFRPVEALIANTNTYDNRYLQINNIIKMKIQTADRAPASTVRDKMNPGDHVIVLTDKGFQRGIFVSGSKSTLQVHLMDRGNTMNVDINNVSVMTDEESEKELFQIPPRILECTLTEVEPSSLLSPVGKWTKKAIEVFKAVVDERATIRIYSVVDDVVSVTLIVKKVNWNEKLITEKFAQDCEESYLSKADHEYRYSRRIEMLKEIWPEDEFAGKLQKAKVNRFIEAPPLNCCKKEIKLHGPFSPLETSLSGISRFKSSGVVIDQSSVNSVLLSDDILNFHEKFCVAAEVTYSKKSQHITVRDTNLMPNIPGLAVLLALIFCPTAELRRNKQNTRYVSILTGLGFDKKREQPYYGERDAMLPVDFELTVDDLDSINHLRYCMSRMLMLEPETDAPNLVEREKETTLEKIREIFLGIVNKTRPFMDVDAPHDAFDWNVDQIETVFRSDPEGESSIFSFIGVPVLYKMAPEMKKELQQHIMNLNQCASNHLTLHKKLCRLCNFEWETTPELKLHLLSKKHIKRCASLTD